MRKIVVLLTATLFLGFFSVVFIRQINNSASQKTVGGKELGAHSQCKDCNVIFITLTNLRYDHLSQNGYGRPTTPNLDAFAKESIVFDNAFSHSSWTLPESMSLYTSLYPFQHKIMNRYDGSVLSQDTSTLVDILNANGYKTAAFTGGFDYKPAFGLTNRFSQYQECQEGPREVDDYGKLPCVIPKALDWIKNNLKTKFFVHIQAYDPHCPFSKASGNMYDKGYKGTVDYTKCLWTFDRSEPQIRDGKTYYPVYSPKTEGKASLLLGQEDIAHMVALYDESITLSDELLGSFLAEIKEMGLDKNTIVIFTSEHGDMFGKHGRFMRGGPLRGTFYDDVLHIPLLIKNPKLMPARLEGLVEHIDIMPTLLDFLSISKRPFLQGKSLIPLILKNEQVHEYVFAGSEYHPEAENLYFTEPTRVEAIRSKEWKLTKETAITADPPREPVVELYNSIQDREELHNLVSLTPTFPLSEEEKTLKDLQDRLSDWSEKMRGEKTQ